MKIIKYFFLFILLSGIALSVFIATQDSNYTITTSKKIKLPKQVVFNYLNDVRNFEQWQVFTDDQTNFEFDSITKGKNAAISWNNDSFKNIDNFQNDSIIQIIRQSDFETNLKWKLETKDDFTNITLITNGKVDFITKFKAFFSGGIEKINSPIYENTLNSIILHLTEEYSKNSIKNEGIVLVNETFFIKQIITSKIENLGEEIFNSMKKMKIFCQENNLNINGEPFTIFENINFNTGLINYSVCLPISSEIFTNDESDISGGKREAFFAYKTFLTGDYSHSNKAWNENKKGIEDNLLTINNNIKPISIYKKSVLDSNKPSEWITEFLTPVNESVIYIPEVSNDSLTTIQ